MGGVVMGPDLLAALEGMVNYGNSNGIGSQAAPSLGYGYQVPTVTQLQLLRVQPAVGGSIFTISWTDVVSSGALSVDHYNVYATGLLNNNQIPLNVTEALSSPANVVIQASESTPVTFVVQTVLTSGQVSNLDNSPSCNGICAAPIVDSTFIDLNVFAGNGPNGAITLKGFTWSANTPGAGSIAWSTGIVTYNGVNYKIAAGNTSNQWVYWQLSNPLVFGSSNIPVTGLSVDDFIIQDNAGGTFNYATSYIFGDGGRFVITGRTVQVWNSGGYQTATMNAVAGATGNGFISVYPGNSTSPNITLDGSTQQIVFTASTVAGRTLAGYIPVVSWSGGAGYLAVYT